MREQEEVFEGRIHDRPKGEIDWRSHGLPTLRTAMAQAAGVEAIRAAVYEAVIINSQQLAILGIARAYELAEFSRAMAQKDPGMCDLLRKVNSDFEIIFRNSLHRHANEVR